MSSILTSSNVSGSVGKCLRSNPVHDGHVAISTGKSGYEGHIVGMGNGQTGVSNSHSSSDLSNGQCAMKCPYSVAVDQRTSGASAELPSVVNNQLEHAPDTANGDFITSDSNPAVGVDSTSPSAVNGLSDGNQTNLCPYNRTVDHRTSDTSADSLGGISQSENTPPGGHVGSNGYDSVAPGHAIDPHIL
eukprot:770269_1